MEIVFSVKSFFRDFECGQMAYYHFFYQISRRRRYAFLRNIEFLEQTEWLIEILGHLGGKVWATYKKNYQYEMSL